MSTDQSQVAESVNGEGVVGGGGDDGWAKAFLEYEALARSLPAQIYAEDLTLRNYGGFWHPEHMMAPTLAAGDTFLARPTDVILATAFKSGTTWLKALVFSVVHRGRHGHAPDDARHPLLASSPHDLVPFLHSIYETPSVPPAPGPRLDAMPPPRILAVHTPFSSLPASVSGSGSGCRIVYLCRDPKDAFVSLRHYIDAIQPEGYRMMPPLAEMLELFCDGVWPMGPAWDHIAEYWRESVARPQAVMFLRYEHLKEDAVGGVRRLAEFLGCPFTGEEVAGGVPEAIVALCSFDRMKGVRANQEGMHGAAPTIFKNSAFFRKGEVGSWKELLTPDMARRLDAVMEEKLRASGLSLIGGN